MKKSFIYIAISVGICLLVGFSLGLATQNSVDGWYLTLDKPGFIPPNWIFAPVWIVLYVLMGVSAGLVWAKGFYHIWVKTALYHFGLQLLLNVLWGIVFFGFKNPFWGLIIILNLLILLLFTMKWFNVVSRPAAYLFIPYFIWLCFATFLNYRIWEMN